MGWLPLNVVKRESPHTNHSEVIMMASVLKYTEKEKQGLIDALQSNEKELLDGDGHTLYSAKYYLDRGVPESLVVPFWNWNEAGEGKHSIFVDGESVEGVYGINNLEWLYQMAFVLGATGYNTYHGRGTQARAIAEAIAESLPTNSHIVDGVRKEIQNKG